jgi:hypothetical protein
MSFNDFRRRSYVYRNLHKDAFSVRTGGRVSREYPTSVVLFDCRFLTAPAGYRRFLESGVKNVHAGVSGYPGTRTNNGKPLPSEPWHPSGGSPDFYHKFVRDHGTRIRYNPAESPHWRDGDDYQVLKAWWVSLDMKHGVWAYKPTYK